MKKIIDSLNCNFFLYFIYRADMTTVFHVRLYGTFIEKQCNLRRNKLHRMNQGSNCLGWNFSNIDNVRAPIQFRREKQLQHLYKIIFPKEPTC